MIKSEGWENLRKFFSFLLSDPYPNLGYEISRYLKTVLSSTLIILGLSLIFLPFGILSLGLGIFLIFLSLYFFWRIKLVRKLIKTL